MKYTNKNAPLVCMQTESACYRGTKPMTVRGVLWHSTGANNPNLSRYIQPADNAPDREAMLKLIGVNKYGNDYNHGQTDKHKSMGVNAWVGRLADGTVAAVQALPWGWKPWGCGGGAYGSCNDGWIQFEICEDGLTDAAYAAEVYREACELTAYLCAMYHLDPLGTVTYKGRQIPVILDHRQSHLLGFGNNHGDVQHWFPKVIGKTLDDIQQDVARLMEGAGVAVEASIRRGATGGEVTAIQTALSRLGYSLGRWGIDGDYGSATESAVKLFQADKGLAVNGIVDSGTRAALEAAQAALERTYTVVLHGLAAAEMEAMRTRWPDCEVTEE